MAKLLLFDVVEDEFKKVDINTLDDMYNAIGCDLIDMVNRQIGDKRFDIIVDDEGLLKEKPIVSAVYKNDRVALVGRLLFAKHGKKGETVGLTDEEIEMIMSNCKIGVFMNEDNIRINKVVVIDF